MGLAWSFRVWGAWVSPQESGAPAGVTQVNRTAAAGLACLCCPRLGKRAMPYRLCFDYLLYTTSTAYSSLEATWISERTGNSTQAGRGSQAGSQASGSHVDGSGEDPKRTACSVSNSPACRDGRGALDGMRHHFCALMHAVRDWLFTFQAAELLRFFPP